MGFLTQTFEPGPVCLVMECPPGCNLTVCVFERRHDIKKLTASSVSVPLITSNIEPEVTASLRDVEGGIFKIRLLRRDKFPLNGLQKFYWVFRKRIF